MPIGHLLLVMIGAGLGGLARVLMVQWIEYLHGDRWLGFGLAVLIVNVVGSFLLGAVAAAFLDVSWVKPLVLMGMLGAFTTFSTFSAQVLELGLAGRWGSAVGLALGSVLAGVAAAGLGMWLGRTLS